MKAFLILFSIIIFLFACNSAFEAEAVPELNWSSLDLSKAGIPATIQVPEGVSVKAMKFDIIVGDSAYFEFKESKDIIAAAKIIPEFGIEINKDNTYSISDRRTGIESNTVNKLDEFIKESKNLLFYQSTIMGRTEFHFAFFVKIGENLYSLEDSKGQVYNRVQIENMIKSAKSITAQ